MKLFVALATVIAVGVLPLLTGPPLSKVVTVLIPKATTAVKIADDGVTVNVPLTLVEYGHPYSAM
jgi:hypothetical protein